MACHSLSLSISSLSISLSLSLSLSLSVSPPLSRSLSFSLLPLGFTRVSNPAKAVIFSLYLSVSDNFDRLLAR